MSADVGAEVAEVIQARMDRGTSGRWIADYGETPQTLADALAPLIAERVEAAKAEALREAADALNKDGVGFRPGWGSGNEGDLGALDVLGKTLTWLRDRAAALDPEATP